MTREKSLSLRRNGPGEAEWSGSAFSARAYDFSKPLRAGPKATGRPARWERLNPEENLGSSGQGVPIRVDTNRNASIARCLRP